MLTNKYLGPDVFTGEFRQAFKEEINSNSTQTLPGEGRRGREEEKSFFRLPILMSCT